MDSLSHIYGRNNAAFDQLFNASDTLPEVLKVKKRIWLKILSAYYMDIFSGDADRAYAILVYKIGSKFDVSSDIVKHVLDISDNMTYPLVDHVLLTKDLVPLRLSNKLIKMAGQEEFNALLIRYYPLLLSSGLFLSTDSRLVEALKKNSKLPFIECYASPFNNNIKNYCSLFREDRAYGAWPRFDDFITYINYPCRLYINPPYTPDAMKTCINAIIKYMSQQKGEFICLLPIMYDYEPLDRLLAIPSTYRTVLNAGEYTLHSFTNNKTIVATMNLQVVINVHGNPEEYLGDIVKMMKLYANEVHDISASKNHTRSFSVTDRSSWKRIEATAPDTIYTSPTLRSRRLT